MNILIVINCTIKGTTSKGRTKAVGRNGKVNMSGEKGEHGKATIRKSITETIADRTDDESLGAKDTGIEAQLNIGTVVHVPYTKCIWTFNKCMYSTGHRQCQNETCLLLTCK